MANEWRREGRTGKTREDIRARRRWRSIFGRNRAEHLAAHAGDVVGELIKSPRGAVAGASTRLSAAQTGKFQSALCRHSAHVRGSRDAFSPAGRLEIAPRGRAWPGVTGDETAEQLHSILGAELVRRWIPGAAGRNVQARYCTTKSGLATTVWKVVPAMCCRRGPWPGARARALYNRDASIVPEDRKLILPSVILAATSPVPSMAGFKGVPSELEKFSNNVPVYARAASYCALSSSNFGPIFLGSIAGRGESFTDDARIWFRIAFGGFRTLRRFVFSTILRERAGDTIRSIYLLDLEAGALIPLFHSSLDFVG
ncbi:hypothetical protein KM043_012461 [Ampulex compressa]|nr:hypothetical protein KM043_012461 [Ampulex compressa]